MFGVVTFYKIAKDITILPLFKDFRCSDASRPPASKERDFQKVREGQGTTRQGETVLSEVPRVRLQWM